MNTFIPQHQLLLAASAFFLLPVLSAQIAFSQDDPRHTFWQEIKPYGTMYGDELELCDHCAFAGGITLLGDIDNSGTQDFALNRGLPQPDGEVNGIQLIYKGIVGRLPDITEYQVLEVGESGSHVSILASGDWDGDGWRDLCVDIEIDNDTSEGNDPRYMIGRVVVFWNDGTGNFSLNDTTRLPNPLGSSDVWWGSSKGISHDWSGDGIDDLLVWAHGAVANGERLRTAPLHLYYGEDGRRWGEAGVSAFSDWQWWVDPPHRFVQMKDQNCDNQLDLIFLDQGASTRNPSITICYGNAELDAPDTTDCVTVEFYKQAGGNWASLQDVTGDKVLDLVLAGSDSRFWVYAGEPGARIDSIFGTGNDPPDPEHGRAYARPWAKAPMPNLVNESWGNPNGGPIFELGDVDLDGADDIVAFTSGYVCVWRVVNFFDSLIDGYIPEPGIIRTIANLGDIDSSGLPTYALGYYTGGSHPLNAGAISFYKPDAAIPKTGRFRIPPHDIDVGNRCYGMSGVEVLRMQNQVEEQILSLQ